jgi:hypothetical protein
MDKEKMVNKLKIIIKEFVDTNGDFNLVMLIPTDPGVIDSKFSLLVSAPWLDKKNPKRAIRLITKSLREKFNSHELNYITRVTIINSNDKFVKAINSAFNVRESDVNITNCNIFGIQIDMAILLESHQELSN